jgi:hypothetical protein
LGSLLSPRSYHMRFKAENPITVILFYVRVPVLSEQI